MQNLTAKVLCVWLCVCVWGDLSSFSGSGFYSGWWLILHMTRNNLTDAAFLSQAKLRERTALPKATQQRPMAELGFHPFLCSMNAALRVWAPLGLGDGTEGGCDITSWAQPGWQSSWDWTVCCHPASGSPAPGTSGCTSCSSVMSWMPPCGRRDLGYQAKVANESHYPREEGEDRELTRGINQLQNFPGAYKRSM